MTTKVIEFACKHPRGDGPQLIDEQISAAHRYYNKLIELYRAKLTALDAARNARFPAYAQLQADVAAAEEAAEAIVMAIRAANAKAKRKRASQEEAAQLKTAKERLKALREQRKAMKTATASDPGLLADYAKINVEYDGVMNEQTGRRDGGKFKDARATCGVYWGTYLRFENAFEAAKKAAIGPPFFKRWTGDGQIAIQVQGGATWQEMLIGSGKVGGLLKAEPLPCNRVSPKAARPWLFSMRVQSDPKGHPIWVQVMAYVRMDRMPDDARIMWVSLVRKKLPSRRMADGKFHDYYDWSLQFTIRTAKKFEPATSGACGIDIGWRMMDDDLRVAYLVDDAGHHEELRLPAKLLARWSKSRSIQGIRDLNFDAAKAGLIEWKQSQAELPEWFAESAKLVGQWKAKGRLARLIDDWSEKRIAGDDAVFAMLSAWREQDVHLWQYQVENERKAQRIRLHLYREFAAKVAKKYRSIKVEDCDWRQLARKPEAEDNRNEGGAREHMRTASVGKLRELLKQGGAVMVDSVDTTRRCHACGSIEEWDKKELMHTCEACGLTWDQDHNAAMNLLASDEVMDETQAGTARNSVSVDAEGVAADAPVYVGRWAKRKANRSQKEAESKAV